MLLGVKTHINTWSVVILDLVQERLSSLDWSNALFNITKAYAHQHILWQLNCRTVNAQFSSLVASRMCLLKTVHLGAGTCAVTVSN